MRDSAISVCRNLRSGLTRQGLIREQNRLGMQLEETSQLITIREARAQELGREIAELDRRRTTVAHDLNAHMQSFVSDQAEQIAETARGREELIRTIDQLTDYLTLYSKLDAASRRSEELATRVENLQSELEAR